ncbi:hypothetical protein R50912_11150 [Paenibacillus sp. FSL R5-0912]|nr:hypothetical protein R50912_11150 [Paenibacillus sp. FSL R5-0912]
MLLKRAVLYLPNADHLNLFQHESLNALYDLARSTGCEVTHLYCGLGEDYEHLVSDALAGRFQVIVAMELSPLLACTDLCEALRPNLVSGDLHLITRDGLVNTVRDGASMLGYYLWS